MIIDTNKWYCNFKWRPLDGDLPLYVHYQFHLRFKPFQLLFIVILFNVGFDIDVVRRNGRDTPIVLDDDWV